MDTAAYLPFIHELAEKSGDFIRPFFANPDLAVETKSDATPVTQADRGAEEILRALIRKKFPAHGILGEEFGEENPGAEFTWVLDPIDGTKSFVTACPLFGTLIALLHRGRPVLGAIHQPVLRQLLIGDGRTATLNGRAVRCRASAKKIEDATLLTSGVFTADTRQNGPAFAACARRAKIFRTWGDCYGYLLLATGWADLMTDAELNPWDIAAIIPVVRGAGGVITDWQGRDPVSGHSLVAAATPSLHAEAIAALNP